VLEIVNGYLCMNCCDIDKARLGIDPHQSTNQIQKQLNRQLEPLAPSNSATSNSTASNSTTSNSSPSSAKADFGPAVTLGGSLRPAGAVAPAASANEAGVSSGIDIVA
jgi:hypothetical protein